MSVAPTFVNYDFLSDVFIKNKKEYITVRNPKTGKVRDVRWYAEGKAPVPKGTKVSSPFFDARRALGFQNGYITLFKGDVTKYEDWFNASVARYHCGWGWYVASIDEVPTDLPPGIEPVKFTYEEAFEGAGNVKTGELLTQALEKIISDNLSKSRHIGELGKRLDLDLTIQFKDTITNHFGSSYVYTMEDANGNIFSWSTSARDWEENTFHTLRGTVKGHIIENNTKITILTRCTERK